MTTVQLLIVCVTTLLLAVIMAAAFARPAASSPLSGLTPGATVSVTLSGGQTLIGTLEQGDAAGISLTDTKLRGGGNGSETPMGRVVVPVGAVEAVQEGPAR